MHKTLERVLNPLRDALRTAVTGQAPDGTILKTADERMSVVDGALEEFGEALAADLEEPTPPITKEKPVDAPAKKDPVTAEDVLKTLPEPAQELIRKAQSEAAAATAQVAALSTEVQKQRDEREQAVRITKSAELLGTVIAGEKEKLAEVLKSLSVEQIATLDAIFKSARELIAQKTSVTTEIGKGGKGGADALTMLNSKVTEIRKSDPTVTKEAATAAVLQAHPELYEASLQKGE